MSKICNYYSNTKENIQNLPEMNQRTLLYTFNTFYIYIYIYIKKKNSLKSPWCQIQTHHMYVTESWMFFKADILLAEMTLHEQRDHD